MKEERITVTFPISDTISGPGTYQAEMVLDDTDKNEIPMVKIKDPLEEIENGTAQDVTIDNRAPDPFDD